MNNQPELRERQATAFHEAGHVMMMLNYEWPPESVSIEPDEQGRVGFTNWDTQYDGLIDALNNPNELDKKGDISKNVQ